ncbi:ankyrin repeat domain-containing protein 6-like [Camellia sinensis]|uniref:ankyrin repeat domain-containing protein 6-like n=1 Tax=Camellia sinensis TaxID=4442 RepID=UPI00103646F3|nr:ankyrin repeat domain-containing protein 6-like [Camellia sinensis]
MKKGSNLKKKKTRRKIGSSSSNNNNMPVSLKKAYEAAASKKGGGEVLCKFWRQQQQLGGGGASKKAMDESGNTMLHFMAMKNNTSDLKKLLDVGLLTATELNPRNEKGDTPLHEAAKLGHMNFVEMLVEKNPGSVFERNKFGETPLYSAAAYEKVEVFEFLKWKVYNRRNSSNNTTNTTAMGDDSTVLHTAVKLECYVRLKRVTTLLQAIQKNNLAHKKVLELQKTTRQAVAEAEAKTAQLEQAKKQIAELQLENGRLTGLVSSAEAEKQKIAITVKDKYLRELAKLEGKKDAEIADLKKKVGDANAQGFKEAEGLYILQCEGAKDLFFKWLDVWNGTQLLEFSSVSVLICEGPSPIGAPGFIHDVPSYSIAETGLYIWRRLWKTFSDCFVTNFDDGY